MHQDPLDRTTIADRIYTLLRRGITDHDLTPGQRLVELDLARRFEVSQAPVREALRRLAVDGLVVQLPRRGSFVAEATLDDVDEAYRLRLSLEPAAARTLAQHDDPARLRRLAELITAMDEAAADDDAQALARHDAAFHAEVWAASGTLHTRIWGLLEGPMRHLTTVSNRAYFADLTEVARSHAPLLDALRSGGPELEEVFRGHIELVWNRVVAERATSSTSTT